MTCTYGGSSGETHCTLCDARYVLYDGRCIGTLSKFIYTNLILPNIFRTVERGKKRDNSRKGMSGGHNVG